MKNRKKNFSISLNLFLLLGVIVPAYLQSVDLIPNNNIFFTGIVYLFSIIICLLIHDLLKKIRRRYRAFIIDEAQDNSPLQWRLLSRLWGEREFITFTNRCYW